VSDRDGTIGCDVISTEGGKMSARLMLKNRSHFCSSTIPISPWNTGLMCSKDRTDADCTVDEITERTGRVTIS